MTVPKIGTVKSSLVATGLVPESGVCIERHHCGNESIALTSYRMRTANFAAAMRRDTNRRHNPTQATAAGWVEKMIKTLVAVTVAVVVGLVGFTWFTLHWSYAKGERAGYVQKLSKRGWVCKTWEGEMAMVTMPGTVAEKFYFTVPDDAVASKINASVGARVALHYEQHKWIPSSCFGDTGYFVTDVRETE